MTEQVNATEREDSMLSDEDLYDQEWGTTSDNKSDTDHLDNSAQEKAESQNTYLRTVDDDSNTGDPRAPETNLAEDVISDATWDSASDGQRQAYQKVQNEFNAERGRVAAERKRSAQLDKDLRESRSQLNELTRERGTYETEHPELFNEVKTFMESKGYSQPAAVAPGSDELSPEIEQVLAVHPDAPQLMKTPEWEAQARRFTAEQVRQFNSDNPYDFIRLVNDVKLSLAMSKQSSPNAAQQRLEAAATHVSSGRGSAPATSALSDAAAYDAEWEKE